MIMKYTFGQKTAIWLSVAGWLTLNYYENTWYFLRGFLLCRDGYSTVFGIVWTLYKSTHAGVL